MSTSELTETELDILKAQNNERGIRQEHYAEEIKLDKYKRVIECPVYSTNFANDKSSICGTYIFNYCTSSIEENGDCNTANPSNSRFCEMCGKPTYFFKRGILKPWHELLCKRLENDCEALIL